MPLREFAAARGWTVVDEYVDFAGASDLVRRTEWRRLQEDARGRRVDLVAVWKLDRAFRSAIECLNTLEDWRARGVHLVCVSQPEIDTTTPIGRLPGESADALVTDPPAGISFMGVAWDTFPTRRRPGDRGPLASAQRLPESAPRVRPGGRRRLADRLGDSASITGGVSGASRRGWS